MSFDCFVSRVSALVKPIEGIKVGFYNDTDKGRFFAKCSDGTTIIGNPETLKVTIRWGSGHTAMAAI